MIIGTEFAKRRYSYYQNKITREVFHSEYKSYDIFKEEIEGHPRLILYHSVPHVRGPEKVICVGSTLQEIKAAITEYVVNYKVSLESSGGC